MVSLGALRLLKLGLETDDAGAQRIDLPVVRGKVFPLVRLELLNHGLEKFFLLSSEGLLFCDAVSEEFVLRFCEIKLSS